MYYPLKHIDFWRKAANKGFKIKEIDATIHVACAAWKQLTFPRYST